LQDPLRHLKRDGWRPGTQAQGSYPSLSQQASKRGTNNSPRRQLDKDQQGTENWSKQIGTTPSKQRSGAGIPIYLKVTTLRRLLLKIADNSPAHAFVYAFSAYFICVVVSIRLNVSKIRAFRTFQ